MLRVSLTGATPFHRRRISTLELARLIDDDRKNERILDEAVRAFATETAK